MLCLWPQETDEVVITAKSISISLRMHGMQSVAVIIGFKSTFRVSLTNNVIAEVNVSFLPIH